MSRQKTGGCLSSHDLRLRQPGRVGRRSRVTERTGGSFSGSPCVRMPRPEALTPFGRGGEIFFGSVEVRRGSDVTPSRKLEKACFSAESRVRAILSDNRRYRTLSMNWQDRVWYGDLSYLFSRDGCCSSSPCHCYRNRSTAIQSLWKAFFVKVRASTRSRVPRSSQLS
jgi:hypothetical protein